MGDFKNYLYTNEKMVRFESHKIKKKLIFMKK